MVNKVTIPKVKKNKHAKSLFLCIQNKKHNLKLVGN